MPIPFIVWGAVALFAGGYALDKASDAAEQGAQLAKWGAVAGGVYVSYRALKAAGALK